jgi:hypothetical protein
MPENKMNNTLSFVNFNGGLISGNSPLMLKHYYKYSDESIAKYFRSLSAYNVESLTKEQDTIDALKKVIPGVHYFFILARGQKSAFDALCDKFDLHKYVKYHSSSEAVNNAHPSENTPVLSVVIMQFDKELSLG